MKREDSKKIGHLSRCHLYTEPRPLFGYPIEILATHHFQNWRHAGKFGTRKNGGKRRKIWEKLGRSEKVE